MISVDCIVDAKASLGESPLWVPEEKALYWVDINNRLLHRYDPATGESQSLLQETEIGSIGRATEGRLIAGRRDGFGFIDPADDTFSPLTDPEADKPVNRFNDGKMDRNGHYWCGSMQDPNPDEPAGALYRLAADGRWSKVLDGIRIPNALCWSPDGGTMYFADTRAGAIWAFDFDPVSGEMSNQRVFIDFTDQKGHPDGATVDEEGFLWNAEYGGGRVVRYSPVGQVDQIIELPVANATCCAFGSDDLSILYITTASQRLSEAALAEQPLAGGLFVCEPGVKGLAEPVFGEEI